MSLKIYVLQISTLTKKCFKKFCNGFTLIGKKGNIRSFFNFEIFTIYFFIEKSSLKYNLPNTAANRSSDRACVTLRA